MKKNLLLIPIALTTLIPMVSIVGCGDKPEPEVNEHTVTFSAGEHGTLQGETVVKVKGNETKLRDIVRPTVLADEDHGGFFDHGDHDDNYVINDNVTITALYQNKIDGSDFSNLGEGFFISSSSIDIKEDKIYNATFMLDSSQALPGVKGILIAVVSGPDDIPPTYEFTEESNSTISIADEKYTPQYWVHYAVLLGQDKFDKQQLYFKFKCTQDFDNAYLMIALTNQ